MSKIYNAIPPKLVDWIAEQHLFFVATAPLAAEGHLNLSPKGHDSFRILDTATVAYLDLTGSGVETIAHLRENGRIIFMFCAFTGPPNIVRLYGKGDAVFPDSPEWPELDKLFPQLPGTRSIIRARLDRVSETCGYAVPKMEFLEERTALLCWSETKGEQGVIDYQQQNNVHSIDGLPGLEPSSGNTAAN